MRINQEQRKRFLSVMRAIMDNNNIKTEMEFCLINDLSHNAIQEIKSGRTGISKNVEKILIRYGASLNYIYKGIGEKLIKPLSEMTIGEKLDLIIELLQKK